VPLFPLPKLASKLTFWLILLAGLIHGLLYVFIVPPWQHYDEPGHFEYAWLIANHRSLSASTPADTDLRRQMAASMMEHDFFAELGFHPNLLLTGKDISIGISQTDDSPLYYALVAIPLWLTRHSEITFQLYLGRLVSLALYLLTLATAFGVTAELTPPTHPLRWLVPATLALMPGFTDSMTAVNNDAGATAALSLFLWAGVCAIRRGFSLRRLAAMLASTALCATMKSTSAIALLLAPIPLCFSLLSGQRRRLAWILLGLSASGLLAISLRSGGVASWYPSPYTSPCQSTSEQAPLGQHVFHLASTAPNQPAQLAQPIPSAQARLLAGKTVTFGAWLWASEAATACLPAIYTTEISQASCLPIPVTPEPVFHAISITVPADSSLLRVALLAPQTDAFYDGLVLIEGDFAARGTPSFSTPDGSHGEWDGEPFTNYLRNASAERSWLTIWPAMDALISRLAYIQLAIGMTSLSDLPATSWYYRSTGAALLRTFWGRFGWGHVSLPGGKPYRLLGSVTLIGLAGLLSLAWRRRRSLPWVWIALLLSMTTLCWGAALMRGNHSLIGTVFIPPARYAYPAMIATLLLLTAGWLEIGRLAQRWCRIPLQASALLYILAFLALDILSLATIIAYYRLR